MVSKIIALFVLAARLYAADALTIAPAVRIEAPTVLNHGYTLQASPNLQYWTNWGPVFLGDTSVARWFDSSDAETKYFRLQANSISNLNRTLETIRRANNVPGVACVVVRSNQIIAAGVAGVRKWGVPAAPVTIHDRWHQGSLTKSMTATLAAILVEQGTISWTSKISDVFPDLAASMEAQWHTVTLEMLLSHRSGARGDLSEFWDKLWNFGGTPREARRFLLEKLTAAAPRHAPGTRYEYSNAGYALAGAMLEETLNKPWEDLITEHLFQPLGMTSAAFGVPATPRLIDQAWGHVFNGSTPSPIAPGTNADNPPAIAPGGTVNCSAIDMARYLLFHLAGEKGDTPILKRSSFLKLHAALAGQSYALGWNVTQRDWGGGKVLNHTGSNLQWYSNMWLAPAKDFAVIAMTNIGDANGGNVSFETTDSIIWTTIQKFLL